MQQLAAIFPLKWLTQGMRSVFLPDDFATQEVAGTWELGKTVLVLLIWLVLGLIFAIKKFPARSRTRLAIVDAAP